MKLLPIENCAQCCYCIAFGNSWACNYDHLPIQLFNSETEIVDWCPLDIEDALKVAGLSDQVIPVTKDQVERKNALTDVSWNDIINAGLPDENTPYTMDGRLGKYVDVLAYDKNEEIDTGYCIPFKSTFFFTDNCFKALATDSGGKSVWVHDTVTHWRPLPESP